MSSCGSLVILSFTITSIFASYLTNETNPKHIKQEICTIDDKKIEWSDFLKTAPLRICTDLKKDTVRIRKCNFTFKKHHFDSLKHVKMCLSLSHNDMHYMDKDLLADMKNLIELYLSYNKLRHLAVESFNHNSQLETLDLSKNNLEMIEPGTFDQLKNLEWLNLCNNNLIDLQSGIFNQLKNLKTLNLGHNYLTKLQSGIFDQLVTLEKLDLNSNNLVNLTNDIFAKLENLEELILFQNNFTDLPRNLLQNNTKLKEVRLFENKKNLTLPEEFFSNLTNLKILKLRHNGLVRLPEDLFRNSRSLNTIKLNNNYLQSLPENIFQDLENLTTLDLSNNRITSIFGQLFKELKNLEELNMNENHLRTISCSSFNSLEKLRFVYLSHNYLTLEPNDSCGLMSPFNKCELLEKLDLANNNISMIFYDWIIKQKLNKLDLSYNNIAFIEAEDLMFQSNDISVDLTYNKIQHIFLHNLENLSTNLKYKHVKIHVENNPLSCDCDIYDLLRYMENEMHFSVQNEFQIEIGSLTCYSPENMKNIRVANLLSQRYSKNLTCRINNTDSIAVCPENCDCILKPFDKAVIFNCSHKNLTSVANIKEPNISTIKSFTKSIDKIEQLQLDFSNNQLTQMPNLKTIKLGLVKKLILSHNNISQISLDGLSSTIEVLELHNNSLSRIEPNALNVLNNSNLKQLTIHENPWECDCNAKKFYDFIQSKSGIIEISKVICHGKNKSRLEWNDFCPTTMFDPTATIYISVAIALLGLIIGIFGLFYKYEEKIKIWLFAHKWCLWFVTEEELDKNKLYDAFVSFSHEDEDFIVNELVPKLESGPTPFKLCLHYRDWLAGEWISKNIVDSVENSRRTIVVLSPNFLKSIWGIMEFRTAHCQALTDGRTRIILILYQDVGPINNLDSDLKAYIKMNTYIKWGDPWFWDQLRYALPHQRRLPQTSKPESQARRNIFKNHQLYIQAIENKNELIYPMALPETPAVTTPPADSVKMCDEKPEEESRNYLLQKSYKLNDDIAVIHTEQLTNHNYTIKNKEFII